MFKNGPIEATSNPFGPTPDFGSYFVFSSSLRTKTDSTGNVAGWNDGVCNFVIQRNGQNEYLCTLTITFNSGLGNLNPKISLTGSYAADAATDVPPPFTRAITGGTTGKYYGASGSMKSTQNGGGKDVYKHELTITTCKYQNRRRY